MIFVAYEITFLIKFLLFKHSLTLRGVAANQNGNCNRNINPLLFGFYLNQDGGFGNHFRRIHEEEIKDDGLYLLKATRNQPAFFTISQPYLVPAVNQVD